MRHRSCSLDANHLALGYILTLAVLEERMRTRYAQ